MYGATLARDGTDMLIPIGLDDMKVGRMPTFSIAIAAICLGVFLITLDVDVETLWRWGLVPDEGATQAGWISYMFLHADWSHLLGNFLFLYIAGPYVEDAWGYGRFLALYIIGGLVAGLGQVVLDPSSTVPIIGASGAIAACMGAFCVQFPRRRVRIFYWFFLRLAGTFFIPVWLWGAFWFAKELFFLTLQGAHGGVALGAHLAGFAFGAAMAFAVIKLQGDPFEARYGRRLAPPTPAIVQVPSRPPIVSAPRFEGPITPARVHTAPVDEPIAASMASGSRSSGAMVEPERPSPPEPPSGPPRPFPKKPRVRGE